jgi:hypothetical protein
MDSNCLETYIDSDFKEDVSEGKIESVTISDDREETIFQEFEEKVEDKDIEEIFIENEPEDDDNKQDSAEENDDYEEEQDDNIDNNDEETEEPIDDFNLEFTLDLDEIYAHTEPIHVTAIIKNNGEKTVELCEIDVKLRSLDFEIETPAGNIIHYVGPFEGKGEALKLNPFESISYKINLTSTNVSFGDTMNGPTGLFGSYNFLPGSYTIQGIYISYQTLTAESSSYFQGVLYSPSYNFIIREGPAPN